MRACDDNDDGCDGGQTDENVTLPLSQGKQKYKSNRFQM